MGTLGTLYRLITQMMLVRCQTVDQLPLCREPEAIPRGDLRPNPSLYVDAPDLRGRWKVLLHKGSSTIQERVSRAGLERFKLLRGNLKQMAASAQVGSARRRVRKQGRAELCSNCCCASFCPGAFGLSINNRSFVGAPCGAFLHAGNAKLRLSRRHFMRVHPIKVQFEF